MDENRFDGFTRALATRMGRRSAMSALAGGFAASILGRQTSSAAKLKGPGVRCHASAQCASGYCDSITHQCLAPCTQGNDCGYPQPCAPGCSCYCDPFATNPDGSIRRFCLQDPPDPATCAGLPLCLNGDQDCPRGMFCTASSACGADSVCLPLCAA